LPDFFIELTGEYSLAHALTFWAPGLLNKLRVKEAQETLLDLKLPALQTILARADRFSAKQQSFFEQASYLFHQSECLPIAATQARSELKEFDASHFWLSVDPVQMIPDRDTLVLVPGNNLQITNEESKQLITSFNEHFAEDNVELIWASATHWYLSIVQPVDIKTATVADVAYKPVNEYFPSGHAAQYWRQLINETQMLFYSHPVNLHRRMNGMPEINSVWVWGEGKIYQDKLNIRMDSAIWSNHAYLKGMAKLAQSQTSSLPESYQAWFNRIEQSDSPRVNKHFICLDSLVDELENLQLEEWISLLEELEKEWFEPLLQAVREGVIDSLLLDLGQEYTSHLSSSHTKRFWRFKKSLSKA